MVILRYFVSILYALLLFALGACTSSSPHTEPITLSFVRSGLAVEGTLGQVELKKDGLLLSARRINLDGRRQLLLFDWEPGIQYEVWLGSGKRMITAPLKPSPYLIRTIPLETGPGATAASAIPDSALRFTPDGSRLAIGTLFGYLQVVDIFQGTVLWKRKIAEGMVKRVAFSPDGAILYAGEQSPDGYLYAFDTATGQEKWKLRLADDLETSQPPSAEDRYAVYFLPGVYQLKVAADGRIFVAGTHSWHEGGVQKNRAKLYVLNPDGTPVWTYPEEGALDCNITTFEIDAQGMLVVLATSRSATTPATGPIRGPGVYGFDVAAKREIWRYALEPLEPYFKDVFIWEAVGLTQDGARAIAGLGDGRAVLLDTHPSSKHRVVEMLELGTPMEVSGVPIATPIPYAIAGENVLFFQTGDSNIPAATSASARTPPAPHPAARTLFALDRTGKMLWRYKGDFAPAGIWRSKDGRLLMMTTANPHSDPRTDKHGFVLLDTTVAGSGDDKVIFSYPTEGTVFFHADLSQDGFAAAITETPALKADGKTVYGTFQVHVVH